MAMPLFEGNPELRKRIIKSIQEHLDQSFLKMLSNQKGSLSIKGHHADKWEYIGECTIDQTLFTTPNFNSRLEDWDKDWLKRMHIKL